MKVELWTRDILLFQVPLEIPPKQGDIVVNVGQQKTAYRVVGVCHDITVPYKQPARVLAYVEEIPSFSFYGEPA